MNIFEEHNHKMNRRDFLSGSVLGLGATAWVACSATNLLCTLATRNCLILHQKRNGLSIIFKAVRPRN